MVYQSVPVSMRNSKLLFIDGCLICQANFVRKQIIGCSAKIIFIERDNVMINMKEMSVHIQYWLIWLWRMRLRRIWEHIWDNIIDKLRFFTRFDQFRVRLFFFKLHFRRVFEIRFGLRLGTIYIRHWNTCSAIYTFLEIYFTDIHWGLRFNWS